MGSDDDVEGLLAKAYAVDGPDANRELYAEWAATYDETFVERSRYIYHHSVAEIFVAGFASGAVLDVGCGTGIVGIALRQRGVTEIDGIDISAEMLAQAATRQFNDDRVYDRLIEADLTGTIALPDDHYAGIVSAGTFTHGHLGPESLGELLRVAAPAARCAIGINAAHFDDLGFSGFLDSQRDAGVISSYELLPARIYADADPGNPDHVAHVAAFDVR